MKTQRARFFIPAFLILLAFCLPGLSTIPARSEMPAAAGLLNQSVSPRLAHFDTKAPLTGTWSALTSGTANNLFSVHFVNNNEGWAVGAGNTILHTTNGGATWAAQTNQGGVPASSYLGVRFINSSIGWAGGGSAVLRTTDGGASWVDQGAVQDGRFRNNIFAVSSTVAWLPAQGVGLRWFTRVTSGIGEQDFNAIASGAQYFDIHFTDANNGWSVGTGPIVKISNASGASPTFGFQTTCPCPTLNGLYMLDSLTGWAVGNGGLILKTTNGGSTWPAQTSGTVSNLRSVHFVDANSGWAVGAGGLILMSTNGGTSWTQETSGVATELRRVFFVSANVGYAVGASGTILKRTEVPVPQTFIVTNTNDSGAGSLRQAMLDANANPEADTIIFNIPTSDPNFDGTAFYIRPTSGQLVLTDNGTFIDGSTQSAFSGDSNPNGPEVVIDENSNSCGAANCNGLKIQSSNNRIRDLVIHQVFDLGGTGNADGISLSAGATGNIITGCYIGTDVSGTSQVFVDGHGIASAGGNTIGGAAAGEGNLISGCGTSGFGGLSLGAGDIVRGNKIGTDRTGASSIGNSFYGISIASGSGAVIEGNLISGNFGSGLVVSGSATGAFVRGNKIGTDITGTSALGNNGDGIEINGAVSNTVGGTTAADRNILSGNTQSGVQITGAAATGNLVLGNFIGTNITGAAAVRNTFGVSIQGAPGNTIGGTTAGARNIISGHNTQNGVGISGPTASGNVVQGNYIGTDVSGSVALGNQLGLVISGPNNTIGGAAAGAGNVISGNERGLDIVLASGNVVQGNFIGTNPSGTAALPNALSGIFIASQNNTIGGTTAGARNIISGNGLNGVEITNATGPKLPPSGNVVIGNYIGADVTGMLDLGNAQDGVHLYAAPGNTIGGTTSGERNVISGNNRHGVYIEGNSLGGGDGNIVRGNYIGTKLDGISPLPNSQTGVLVRGNNGAVSNNIVGGTATGAGNTIAYNGGGGVLVSATFGPSTGNAILSNSISSNTGLGIDLGPAGVTPNDAGDADTGVNNLQNFPSLTSVTFSGGNTTILGTLHSTANTIFRVEFFSSASCDPSGHGEGGSFLGAANVTTDSSGVSSFAATFAVAIAAGQVLTATATDSANNSSEFSACLSVPPITLAPATLPGGISGAAYNQTITASGGTAPYTFAITSGSLPAGLTLSSSGALTGTPTAGGGFTFTIRAADSASMTGSRSYTLAIAIPNPCASPGFDPQTLFATGTQPEFVVARDFNHDGKLDLAVANAGAGNVSIMLGTGSGAFGAAVNFGVGSSPQSIAAGDFNGDTHLDLAVPNRSSNDVSILLGNGAGGFSAATNFGGLTQPEFAAAGDFNGDGKLDLAVANFGSNNISILLGNGAGAFGAASNFDAEAGQQAVVAADFNSDGALDLVVSHNSVNTISLLLGNGAGSFAAPASFQISLGPWSLATGDFNEDGKFDLAVGKFQGLVAVLLGDGAGSFSPPVDYATGQAPLNIAVGDLNGDGHQDLAVSNANTSFISILAGNGAGGFGAATNTTVGLGPFGIATGDFDGDGRGDLAVARQLFNDVAVLLKTCCPVITLSPSSLPAGAVGLAYNQTLGASGGTPAYTFAIAAGALPSGLALSAGGVISGTPVVAGSFTFTARATDAGGCTGARSYTIAVASSAPCASASFLGPTNFGASTLPVSVAAGDFNGDAKLDLAVANLSTSANTVSVLTGNGNGSFGAPASFGAGAKPRSVAAGDFNNDNKLDLAVANLDSNDVSVLLGNGLGGFGAAADFAVETGPIDVKLADFNRDGNLDIAVANASSGTVSILIGNGAGGFAPAANFGGAANAGGITVGDFNGDGRLDIAAASQVPARVAILLGNGAGGFGGPMTFSIGTHPSYVATADFNNDGRLDLAVTDLELERVSIVTGDGGGGFGSQMDFPVGTFPSYVAVSDFNGDGRADLAVANLTSNSVSVLINNGAGGFNAALTLGAGTNPRGVAAGDFNNDGKFDFAVANASDNVSIFRNNCGCPAITLSPPTLPSGLAGAAYSQTIIASGGAGPYSFELTSGALPGGLMLSSGGVISGTPSAAGVFAFTVTATDSNGCTGSAGYSITIDSIPAILTVTKTADTNDGSCSLGDCSLREAINAANVNPDANMISFNVPTSDPGFAGGVFTIQPASALPTITRPVTIDGKTQPGFAGTPIVELNGLGVTGSGLRISAGNSSVKGLVINRFDGAGITLESNGGNTVQCNYIGTNPAGAAARGNLDGIQITTTNNTIGGLTAGARNLISGNNGNGVFIVGSSASGNIVQGNFIGVDATGTSALGNGSVGVGILGSSNNTVGGTTANARNIISGNAGAGVNIGGGNTGNLVQGNFIGTDLNGTAAIGNSLAGVVVNSGSSSCTVGGTNVGSRNIISGNGDSGVSLGAGASGNFVQGNFIGTDLNGAADIGNASNGVFSFGPNNTIGGASAGAGNVISGNGGAGVAFSGSLANGNQILGNFIGTSSSGADPVGNTASGVAIIGGTSNTIGGTAAGMSNTIAFNGGDGVSISGTGNAIRGNSIYSNGDLGIDLAPNGVTPNDAGDGDPGANNLQNFPVISSSTTNGAQVSIAGSLNSGASTAFNLEFYSNPSCDGSGNGEGQTYIGSILVTTDGSGNSSFAVSFVASIPAGQMITATAADPAGNTSEFSACSQAATGSTIPAGSYSTVTIANGTALTLSGDVTITGQLTLDGGLNTGAFTLTMPAGAATTGNSDVIGNVRRTGFVIGAALSFGNPFNSIRFDSGTPPTEVSVNLVKSAPIGFPNAVERTYTITPVGGSGYNATLQLHYLDSELNSNSEATLEFWRHNGTVWAGQGAATRDATDNWVRLTGVTEFSPWVMAGPGGPTAIQLVSFTAAAYQNGIFIEWQTGFEADNLGFNVYRDEGGKRVLVNNNLVAGSALRDGAALRAGESYGWWDKEIADCGLRIADCRNALYWLEDIDLKGASTWHGPFAAKAVGGAPPARSNAGTISKIGSFKPDADSTRVVEPAASLSPASATQAGVQSTLASQAAVKISITREGWYRLTQPALIAAGLNPRVGARFLQLFVDGREIPIHVSTNKDGSFDQSSAVEFYGIGLDTPSSDARTYWLVAGEKDGKRIAGMKPEGESSSAQSFTQTVERKDRTIYFSSLRNGDKENFFGAIVAGEGVGQTISLAHLAQYDSSNFETTIEVALQGVTLAPHRVLVQLNGTAIREISFGGQQQGLARFNVNHSLLCEGVNTVRLVPQNGAGDVSLVDHIRISYQHAFVADEDALRFTASGGQRTTVVGFSSKAIRVFDVTDASNVQELIAEVSDSKNGFAAAIAPREPGVRTLIALTDDKAKPPSSLEANRASSWRSPANAADLVIITTADLLAAIEPLRDLRQAERYKVALVEAGDIYDEFNFGHKSPQAIKDFLLYASANWKLAPRFVLFAGDASFDARNYLGLGYNDLVPTKLVDTNFLETASDDWFADFNSDGVAEMAVGRLPVRDAEEAATVVSKLISYSQSKPLASVALVSDMNDGFNFEQASAQLRPLFPSSLKIDEIRRGEFDPATAKARLLEAINRGQKLINYVGHGSANQWRGGLLTSADANALTNNDRLPVFVMMTCLNGYFHDAASNSLAESLIKAEHGGAIAVWASSGMTLPAAQVAIDRELYRLLFAGNSDSMTLGEATRRAKLAAGDKDTRLTWTLLGDPTIRIK